MGIINKISDRIEFERAKKRYNGNEALAREFVDEFNRDSAKI